MPPRPRRGTDTARARLDRATADAAKVRLAIEQEAISAWLTYQTASKKVAVAEAGLEAAKEGYDLANLRYNTGKSVTAERLDV